MMLFQVALTRHDASQSFSWMTEEPVQAFGNRLADPAEIAQLLIGRERVRNDKAPGLQCIHETIIALRSLLRIIHELRKDDDIAIGYRGRHGFQCPRRNDDT